MRKRKATPDFPSDTQAGSLGAVLVASQEPANRSILRHLLEDSGFEWEFVSTLAQAHDALQERRYDAVICEASLPDAPGLELIRLLAATQPAARTILLSEDPTVDLAVAALRLGAIDLLRTAPLDSHEALASIHAAVSDSREARGRSKQIKRLRRANRRLEARRERTDLQVNALCADMVGAYQELADKVNSMTLASEFNAVIQQELDIESLLRKVLEFMLQKIGPTNAAIYLPSNHSDFSLGAYVNYDCPRDAADMLLEHLADVLPGAFQDDERVRTFATADDLADALGDDHLWIEDSAVLVASCRSDDECLAVLTLFRDDARPFNDEVAQQVETMASLFAAQLARVIRVHHRHTEAEEEFGWDVDEETGDGFGGLAA
ncbi:MAG: response regulator [Phycisphaerales bacterium]